VLSGLHYSHELVDSRGLPLELVHRDVTPHNVFVTYDGRVKVLDFGIAKVRNSSVRTETGIVKGKLRYIPPEQFLGEVVDRRADIYSVGVMLWETAAGEKLWRGLSDAVVMNRVINEQIPRPSVRNPDACPLLEAVLMKALNPDPNQRHQTALQLKQELDEVRQALAAAVSPRSLLWAMDAAHGAERRTTRARVDAQLEELKRGETPASGGTLKTFAAAKPPRTRSFGAWWTLVPVVGAIGAWVWLLERLGTSEHALQPAELPSATAEGLLASPEAPAQPVASHTLAPAALRSAGSSETAASGVATAAPLAERSPTPARSGAPPQANAAQPRVDATAAPTAPGEPSSPRKAAKPAACEPPFVLDERGLKRFKPECLR
jgi:serine/threonine-protein kinase